MKKLLIASLTVLSLTAGPAAAADLGAPSYKAPPPAALSWTGFYLNVGGGYGLWQANSAVIDAVTGTPFTTTQSIGGKGYLGTVGGGFDYEFGGPSLGAWNPQIVVGVFGDYNFESIKGTIEDIEFPAAGTLKETNAWAAGARIGLVPFPQMLTYINGGVTETRFGGTSLISETTGTATGFVTSPFNRTGWFLGGGTETSLSPLLPAGWFLRSEYRYSYFGTANVRENVAGASGLDIISFQPTVQTITASLVFKFNWMGH
jgi:outer membrane immunogenic protein